MQKRGQVTIFIVVGLFLVLFAGIFFAFRGFFAQGTETTVANFSPIMSYVQSCFDNTADSAVIFVSKRGGYYDLPENSDAKLAMPYYLFKEENNLVSLETIQNELSAYIERELPFCLRDFSVMKDEGYTINAKNPLVTTSIADESINFALSMEIEAAKGDQSVTMKDFSYTLKTRLGMIYGAVEEFISLEAAEPSTTCVSCLFEAITAEDVKSTFTPLDDDKMLFTFVDEKNPIDEEILEYNFINVYDYQKPDLSVFGTATFTEEMEEENAQ